MTDPLPAAAVEAATPASKNFAENAPTSLGS